MECESLFDPIRVCRHHSILFVLLHVQYLPDPVSLSSGRVRRWPVYLVIRVLVLWPALSNHRLGPDRARHQSRRRHGRDDDGDPVGLWRRQLALLVLVLLST